VLRVLRLRWYVVAVVLFATAIGGWQVKHPQPLYQGTSIVVLAPPEQVTAPNKLVAVTPSLAVAGLAVNMALLGPTQTARLRQAGVLGDYTITPRNNGTDQTPQYFVPSELISVETDDPAVALHSVAVLQSLYGRQLAAWQTDQGVAQSSQVTAQVLAAPSVQQVLGSHSRGLIGTALLGAGAAIALPLWFDRYVNSRPRRGGRPRRVSRLRIPRPSLRRPAESLSEGGGR
jgi:hypothetical protein